MQERLRRCIGDEMLMYSTLAYSSGLVAWINGNQQQQQRQQSPEYFIGRALPAVRRQIQDLKQLTNTWLLLSIYSLTITELWDNAPDLWTNDLARCPTIHNKQNASFTAARTHLRALLSMVRDIGGLDKIGPYITESMILADEFTSTSMTMPILPLT